MNTICLKFLGKKGLPTPSSLLLVCYLTGMILCFCDIKQTNMNLDDIKSHELFNVLLSSLADLLVINEFYLYQKSIKTLEDKAEDKVEDKVEDEDEDKNNVINPDPKHPYKVILKYLIFSFILEFLDKSLILICLLIQEDEKFLDTQFIWIFSFDYPFRCIFYSILKNILRKMKVNTARFQNIFICNSYILLTNCSLSLYYLYVINASIQNFKLITIIFSRILIRAIMDNENYYLLKYKNIHISKLMLFRGITNFALFIIFSIGLFFWRNGDKWIFSYLSNMSLDFSGIKFILLKIIYIISLGNQKFALLTLVKGNPILASYSYLIYYLHPYISMIIMIVFYDQIFQRSLLEIKFEAISLLCFLFTLFTSIVLINLPCSCLKNENEDVKEISTNTVRRTESF